MLMVHGYFKSCSVSFVTDIYHICDTHQISLLKYFNSSGNSNNILLLLWQRLRFALSGVTDQATFIIVSITKRNAFQVDRKKKVKTQIRADLRDSEAWKSLTDNNS